MRSIPTFVPGAAGSHAAASSSSASVGEVVAESEVGICVVLAVSAASSVPVDALGLALTERFAEQADHVDRLSSPRLTVRSSPFGYSRTYATSARTQVRCTLMPAGSPASVESTACPQDMAAIRAHASLLWTGQVATMQTSLNLAWRSDAIVAETRLRML
ncbi:MAG: hypothetical protein ACI8Y4_001707 [Candidatus Poriferisodalaceae bacterium]|jgi:hypothetical protein